MADTITRALLTLLNDLLIANIEPHVIIDTLLMKAEILLPGLCKNDYVTIISAIIDQLDASGYFSPEGNYWKGSDRAYNIAQPSKGAVINFPVRGKTHSNG